MGTDARPGCKPTASGKKKASSSKPKATPKPASDKGTEEPPSPSKPNLRSNRHSKVAKANSLDFKDFEDWKEFVTYITTEFRQDTDKFLKALNSPNPERQKRFLSLVSVPDS